jgi:CRISPR-associated endoribonuclease Cas6
MDYHKLQGFVYHKLINSTRFNNLHDLKSYKLFCFSNIFPGPVVKSGQIRNFIFSSPNVSLVEEVFNTIKSFIETKNIQANIVEQVYEVISAEKIQVMITGNLCRIRTSTPLTIRIPEMNYSHYNIPPQVRKNKFIYWRSNLPASVLLDLVRNNILKKYRFFYNIQDKKLLPLRD